MFEIKLNKEQVIEILNANLKTALFHRNARVLQVKECKQRNSFSLDYTRGLLSANNLQVKSLIYTIKDLKKKNSDLSFNMNYSLKNII